MAKLLKGEFKNFIFCQVLISFLWCNIENRA